MAQAHICVDFDRPTGAMKPLHGVNSGPKTKVFTYDSTPLWRKAGLPIARLHDVEYPYGSGEFVDIACVFKNFDADENDPASYHFALTDLYIQAIREAGGQVLYRLGSSIEHAPVKRHILPPRDYGKWARICEHIIRHYNEGWADGHHWDIQYWEIWNEADGGSHNNWAGTAEQFYELYAVTAIHLKTCFPTLKIGGPAFTTAKNDFAEGFFRYLSSYPQRVPLDFYSWHRYFSDVTKLTDAIAQAESLKAAYGYEQAESVLDEWNYMENWRHQAESYRVLTDIRGAAFCGAVLCTLANSPVAMACYFEADVCKEWCGLFSVKDMAIGTNDKAVLSPRKPYYAFYAYNRLYQLGQAVSVRTDAETDGTPGVYACAATNGDRGAVMVSCYGIVTDTITDPITDPVADTTTDTTTVSLSLSHLPGKTLRVSLLDRDCDLTEQFSVTVTGEDESLTLSLSGADRRVWLIETL